MEYKPRQQNVEQFESTWKKNTATHWGGSENKSNCLSNLIDKKYIKREYSYIWCRSSAGATIRRTRWLPRALSRRGAKKDKKYMKVTNIHQAKVNEHDISE